MAVRKFYSIAQKFLDGYYELFPQAASELGLHQYDAQLGSNDAQVHTRYCQMLETTLNQVEALSDIGFTGDAWLDRRGFLSQLRTSLYSHHVLKRWRNNPEIHCNAAVQSIFSLVVRSTQNLGDAQVAIESRLSKIPEFLSSGLDCLQNPVPLWSQLAVKTCQGVTTFLSELERSLLPFSKNPTKTRRLFKDAIAAFGKYSRSVVNKPPGPVSGYAIGRDAFEFLIREKLGLPYSLPEAEAIGKNQIAKLTMELKREASKFGRKSAAKILEEAAAQWNPTSLLSEYQKSTEEIKRGFAAADLLTLPKSERLKVLKVPEFLQHQFPTAAYLQPGPYEKIQEGIFWVNDLSSSLQGTERKKAEIQQHFGLELTCAHEAYPGHHVQFVIQNRHPSKLRRLFAHSIFYEGWTLWCEKMCIEQNIYRSPHARLLQLSDALWRAYRIIIDCGLHSKSLTYSGACKLLTEGVGFTLNRAKGDVNWYTSSPTVPMSYLLGRLELEKLHDKVVITDGWTMKQFNDWILSFGAVPWSWIWQSQLRP